MRILLLCLLLAGCATADKAQYTDIATTYIGLSSGFVEGNPIFAGAAWPVIAVAKIGVTQLVKQTPLEYCQPGLFGLTLGGFGAAVWNIGVMAGSGPAALPIVAGVWLLKWDDWERDSLRDCLAQYASKEEADAAYKAYLIRSIISQTTPHTATGDWHEHH